jgi:hypothetical protein
MAQAECITTAIRELMSCGRPPESTSLVRLAHTEFVAALVGNVPHPIYADVDSENSTAAPTIWKGCSLRCTSISPRSSPTRRATYQVARSIAATLTTCSGTYRPTRCV